MEGSDEKYTHDLYTHVHDKKDADAVAWAFVNKDKFVEFPFKFPELKPNELRANVLYAGLCHSDSLHCRGKWGGCPYPVAPGHEIIAEVSQVGSEVTKFKAGDKVAFGTLREICGECRYCKKGQGEPLCESPLVHRFTYGVYWGGYGTQLQQPADFFIPIPEGLDLAKSAPLLCAGITVYTPMKKYVKPGDEAAVIGVGGLGHLAVQFLAKKGHKVTGVTTTANKKDFILGLGASDVLVSTDSEAMKNSENKFDYIIDTVPSLDGFEARMSLLAPGGTYVIVGVGDVSACNFPVNVFSLVIGERKIVGSLVGKREDIVEMLQFCKEQNIYPMVEEFNFDSFPQALERLENGKPIFRCVVKTEEYSKNNGLFK
jgi:D-arabinose 1-dehydrogenase-like Zn-dependent alcohol dehydrogenase